MYPQGSHNLQCSHHSTASGKKERMSNPCADIYNFNPTSQGHTFLKLLISFECLEVYLFTHLREGKIFLF